jgi:TolB-like protein
MAGKIIDVALYGACAITGAAGYDFDIKGAKHRALIALLVTAPLGRRTRSFLQETLWGVSCYDTGRQSLRRALADIKAIVGAPFGELFSSTNADITINLSAVSFRGHPDQGMFLEGLDIREPGFLHWVLMIRDNPAQLDGLFRNDTGIIMPSTLPVMAVLPFRALASESDEAILGDWLAEDISRSLSRSRLLSVISHLSCRQFVSMPFDLGTIRNDLKADFCLYGSLRRQGGTLRVNVDFIDTASGRILFTREMAGPAEGFLNQAETGLAPIVQSIGAAIADEAIAHAGNLPVHDIADHRLLIAGVGQMHQPTLRAFARSRELIEEARRRAPRVPEIHAWLAKWYVLSVFNGWSTDARQETQLALDSTARALDLSPDNSFALTIDGFAHSNLVRRLDIADQRYDSALKSNPNEALGWLLKGALHTFRNEGEAAVKASETACRLSPMDPFASYYDMHAAGAYLTVGQYDRALDLAERSHRKNDRNLSTLRIKIFAAYHQGRSEVMRDAAAELMRRQPGFTIHNYLRTHPSADSDMGRRMKTALAAANIPMGA